MLLDIMDGDKSPGGGRVDLQGDQTDLGAQSGLSRADRLRLPADMPVVVVCGVLGSGKTTLLRRWFEELNDDGARHPVWLTVDPDDPDQLVTALQTAFEGDDRPATVFVDDFDRMPPEEAQRAALHSVLVRQPSTLGLGAQLVVATTGRPSFPVGPLRAASLVAEIDDERLRWTAAELDELARYRLEAPWPGLGARLAHLTDGWITGVVAILDRLPAGDRSPPDSTIDMTLDAVADDASQHLVGTIESSLDTDEFSFLVRASILESLTPSTAKSVIDDVVQADLHQLERDGFPITRVDRRGDEFVLQPLIRRGLQQRLNEVEDHASRAARHLRAGESLHRSGRHRSAIDHYLAAGQGRTAANVLAELWSLDRFVVTESDIVAVEAAGMEHYVPHLVTTGLVRGDRGQLSEVDRVLTRLETEEWGGPLPHGFSNLDAAIVELQLLLPDRDEIKTKRVVEVLAGQHEDSPDRPLTGVYTAAHHNYYLGRFDEARRLAGSILIGHRSIGRRTRHDKAATILAAGLEALIAHDHGDTTQASRHYEHSLDLADSYNLPGFFPSAAHVRNLTTAVIGGETVDVAQELLTDVLNNGADVSLRTHAGIELIRLMDQDRRYEEATEVLANVERMSAGISLPNMLARRLDAIGKSFQRNASAEGPSPTITPSERFVLHLLVDPDLSQAEIGRILGLSINTVKSHLRSIYQKFGATSREEALAAAAEGALLTSVIPWESSA